MNKSTKEYIIEEFNIEEKVLDIVNSNQDKLIDRFNSYDEIMEKNQLKVLKAFQKNRISDMHFAWNTGYGYDDPGREATEKVYADIFNTEAALVRPNIVNGTHALACTLFGILKPGEELIYCSGAPYDTLQEVIGNTGSSFGSLKDYGIKYKEVALSNGQMDEEIIKKTITEQTKVVAMQRSTGYAWRNALTIEEIKNITETIHRINKDIIVMVDNCYGEFVSDIEPTDVGVDVMAGSLIKNPGGGLALSGGYVVGRKDLINNISYRLTCPGIGAECGLTFGQTRAILQGIFLAPKVVNGALKGAILCGSVFDELGYEICPDMNSKRSDIIQAIKFNNPDKLVSFCQGIQSASPIDAHVAPIPWDMPGYEDQVVMAAGAFVQGSSIELSADAPLREPYIAYFQGGLTYEHSKFGVIKALDELIKRGYIEL
ncbi:MAG: methionine gamma-lyase family protein [Peptostreptococcaceae bacterium]|nr:methionine gamma-lyase family protein [Peptostreptococcaceae bacterium]